MLPISRYKKEQLVVSELDPFEDVLGWVEGLTSPGYVSELLSRHSLVGPTKARDRAKKVAASVGVACKFLDQALRGPKDVSFLPLYYSILNLCKAYITVGPLYNELSANRYHGATYDSDKVFRSLDDDTVIIYPKGTIPLLYRTLMGVPIVSKTNLTLKMSDILSYIPGISHEYWVVTGKEPRLLQFVVSLAEKGSKQRIEAEFVGTEDEFAKIDIRNLQGLKKLRRSPRSTVLISEWHNTESECLAHISEPLLYCTTANESRTEVYVPSGAHVPPLPEEIPLVCAFFHLSSLVRYNPNAFFRLMDSKYLPVLSALRRYGIFRFMLLFWWYMTECCTYLEFPGSVPFAEV